ncbi:energy-coupling factor transporter transmembrane protein EcfT [[Mycoplasma] falconis]|uniref:Energy-coupling factor transporter transmembrane protein EcfT n=1 Tax=[Mycoplasma] falconis TaxID=92403 RepID=A0A501XA37_9BACT|nr:energy-coupling factor transporter transmembrane component T [[Mycoplasma] falconis]TPE57415.1 energy-coupling factor transporter transmembrane protein EcfT [[Mycoplasma] falconis]
MKQAIIGKYLNIDTFIHRLDPRLKFLANVIFIVLLFVTNYFITLGILVLSIMVMYVIATKSIKSVFLKLKIPFYIALFIFIVNMFTVKGAVPNIEGDNFIPISSTLNIDAYVIHRDQTFINTIYWAPFGPDKVFQITQFTIVRTFSILLRIYGVILTTTILMVSTKPILLTRAINDLLLPLKLIKIPTEIITMIISIALRFIPTLLEESSRIMKAQSSRGVDFKNGNLKDKSKAFIVLIIPLFVSSFNKANDLSDAMTSRGYQPYAKRSFYRQLNPSWRDLIAVLFIGLLVAMVTVCQIDAVPLPYWFVLTYQRV